MENEIFDDLKKKSDEIMRSNDDLKSLISNFNQELTRLKNELSEKENSEAGIRKEIDALKLELDAKKRIIAEMIDDMEPLEKDLAEKNGLIEELSGKLEKFTKENMALRDETQKKEQEAETSAARNIELEKEMEQKKQMLTEMKKKYHDSQVEMQKLMSTQAKQKERIDMTTEELKSLGDATINKTEENKILKERLAEKSALVKQLDESNAHIEQKLELAKREAFKFKNRVAAMESRVYETNDKNQKIMYELIKAKERIKVLETEIEKENGMLSAKTAEYQDEIERLRQEEEMKKQRIMKLHSKKIAILNSQLGSMQAHLEKQQKITESRTEKEKQLIADFTHRLKDLTTATAEIPDVETLMQTATVPKLASAEEEEVVVQKPEFYERITSDKIEFEPYTGSKVEEIMPMIEIASQHGDSIEKIKSTLTNSGYNAEDIQEALTQLNAQ